MSFDIGNTLKEMLNAASTTLSTEWPDVRSCYESALAAERDALYDIAQSRIDCLIDDDEMKSQMEDEKLVLKAALLACDVKTKMSAQKAINAGMEVFSNAIKTALMAL